MKENKKEEQKRYSVVVIDWIKGILTKTEKIFSKLNDAKDFAEDQKGEVKIYDEEKKVIFSENKKDKKDKDKKDKKDKKPKKDKDRDDDEDDDDDYN
jgi:hypothetical protein